MPFLPDDYKDPTGVSKYIKPSDMPGGQNKIRILSDPLMGWCYWEDKKPYRVKEFKDVPKKYQNPADNREKAYYFWSMLIWNYEASRVQLMEVRQATIRSLLTDLNENPDWGDPKQYDVTVVKKGEGRDTEYTIQPSPNKKPVTGEIKEALDNTTFNADSYMASEDPWGPLSEAEIEQISEEINVEADLPDVDFDTLDSEVEKQEK